MDSVSASPEVIRSKRYYAEYSAGPIISAALMEKGAMTTIVLDHEQAY